MVTVNLRAALLNIRQLDQPCTLWVDAICINQSNVLERGHQVSIMADIYRNATRTIVWLGDSRPPFTKKAYDVVEELAAEAATRQYANIEVSSNYTSLSQLYTNMERVESPAFHRFRDDYSVIHLACASWWFRTWTVQELVLAPQAVIMTGNFTMDWARFTAGVDYGLAIGIWNPVMLGIVIDPIVIPYLSMSALGKKRQSEPSSQPPFSSPSTVMPPAQTAQALLETLIRCRFRQASDPRDKVYGLLGLMHRDQHEDSPDSARTLGIEPDYGLSAAEVYCQTARQLLLQSADLNMLGASNTATAATAIASAGQTLPSWVPDWNNAAAGPHPLMHDARGRQRQTHASRGTQSTPRFSDDGRVLVLSGHELTTITHLSPVLRRLQRDSSNIPAIRRGDTLLTRLAALGQFCARLAWVYWDLSAVVPHLATFWDWEKFARESPRLLPDSQSQQTSSPPSAPYDPLAIYWQTLCVGTMAPEGREATSQLFYMWRASLRAVFQLRQWHVDSLLRPLAFVGYLMRTWRQYSEFACLLEHVYERRLGRGEDGSLVLLPGEAKVGDLLMLVKGGRQPLALRKNGRAGEGLYSFVGEAYAHGAMDGERFEEAKCVEVRIR